MARNKIALIGAGNIGGTLAREVKIVAFQTGDNLGVFHTKFGTFRQPAPILDPVGAHLSGSTLDKWQLAHRSFWKIRAIQHGRVTAALF